MLDIEPLADLAGQLRNSIQKGTKDMISPGLQSTISVGIITHDPIITSGLTSYLSSDSTLFVTNTLSLDHLFQIPLPSLPNSLLILTHEVNLDIIKICQQFKNDQICTKIILILTNDDVSQYTQAIKLGISGVLQYHSLTPEDLIQAIHTVSTGQYYFSSSVICDIIEYLQQNNSFQHFHCAKVLSTLTNREAEIFAYLMTGMRNREIAEKLCVEVKTVKNHLTNIYSKLQVRSRNEATIRYRTGPIVE